MDETNARDDDGSLEGPDIEMPTGDGDGTLKPGAAPVVERGSASDRDEPAPPTPGR